MSDCVTVKPGRNQPCPCGSGRKYKHCCGSIAVSAPLREPPAAPAGMSFVFAAIKRTPNACAREAPGYSLNSRDFRRARSPQARLTECFHLYRLHTKKRPSVARDRPQRCASRRAPMGAVEERIHRGAGSGASTDVLRDWRPAPRDRRGVGRLPSRSALIWRTTRSRTGSGQKQDRSCEGEEERGGDAQGRSRSAEFYGLFRPIHRGVCTAVQEAAHGRGRRA